VTWVTRTFLDARFGFSRDPLSTALASPSDIAGWKAVPTEPAGDKLFPARRADRLGLARGSAAATPWPG